MAKSETMHYLDVEGGRIAYDISGPENWQAVILIHEAIADRRMWNREFSNLAKLYRVVRYDMRGFGNSTPANSEFSSIDDLKAVIDHLKLKHPIIVGASMGGRIAIDFAIAHPNVVLGLLLISPGFSGMDFPMFPDGVFDADEKASRAAFEAFTAGKVEEAFEHLRGLWGSALKGSNLEFFRTMVMENASEVFQERSGQHERQVEPKAASQLSYIHLPLLVLVGDRDNPAMPHVARYIVDHVPDAKMKIIPGADHLLNLTAPRAFDESFAGLMETIKSSRIH